MQEGERPSRLVEFRARRHAEALVLVESACGGVLLVDVEAMDAPSVHGMLQEGGSDPPARAPHRRRRASRACRRRRPRTRAAAHRRRPPPAAAPRTAPRAPRVASRRCRPRTGTGASRAPTAPTAVRAARQARRRAARRRPLRWCIGSPCRTFPTERAFQRNCSTGYSTLKNDGGRPLCAVSPDSHRRCCLRCPVRQRRNAPLTGKCGMECGDARPAQKQEAGSGKRDHARRTPMRRRRAGSCAQDADAPEENRRMSRVR